MERFPPAGKKDSKEGQKLEADTAAHHGDEALTQAFETDVAIASDIEQLREVAVARLGAYIAEHTANPEYRTLHDKQFEVFQTIHDFIKGGGRTGYIKLPTGTGKTVIFLELIEALDLKTLVITETKVLVRQTTKRAEEFAPDLDVGRVYSQAKEHGRSVTVTTYATAQSRDKHGTLAPDTYQLVIPDEAHKGLTKKRNHMIQTFGDAFVIGFTATPHYSEEKNVANQLGTEIYAMSIREACEWGMLSPFSVMLVETKTDMSRVGLKTGGNYDADELERAVNIRVRNHAAIEMYQSYFKGQSAIAFCAGIAHAHALAEQMREVGIKAEAISGRNSGGEQDDIIGRFDRGELDVLCNAKLLGMGFDSPRAAVALNLTPTRSKVEAEQRAGRVLRIDREDPSKFAVVVDFLDENFDAGATPVTFAEVADTALALPHVQEDEYGALERSFAASYAAKETVSIEGFEIITDPRKVKERTAEMERYEAAFEAPPEGWMTHVELIPYNNNVMNLAHTRRLLALIEAEHPDWFRRYKREGKVQEYVAPEGIEALREAIKNEIDEIPEGWMRALDIAGLFGGRSSVYVRVLELADAYKRGAAHATRMLRRGNNATIEFYSPAMVLHIQEQLGVRNGKEEEQKDFLESFRVIREAKPEDKERCILSALGAVKNLRDFMMLLTYRKEIFENKLMSDIFKRKIEEIAPEMTLFQRMDLAARVPPSIKKLLVPPEKVEPEDEEEM